MLERKNFIWNSIGTLLFGFTSLFFLIIITRINGVDEAGIYSYAFATASILATIGFYSGRTFQVTERNKEISDTDYLYNHLTTFIIMIVLAFLFCLISRANYSRFILIILLSLYRGIETLIDSVHAIIQRNGELYKAGISLFIRTILLTLSLIGIDLLTHNVYLAVTSLVIINLFFLIFVDYRNIIGKYKKTKFTVAKNNLLLKTGLSVCLYQFLAIYIINAPKYAINSYEVNSVQAIFGIISMPASFLVLISNYMLIPSLNKIKEYIEKDKIKNLEILILKIAGGIILIGLLALLVCYFLGVPVLEFIYGIDLSKQRINLLIIVGGSIFYALTILMSAIYVSLRKNNLQLYLLLIITVITYFISNYFVKVYGLKGASLVYLFIMVIEFVLHSVVIWIILNKKPKKGK